MRFRRDRTEGRAAKYIFLACNGEAVRQIRVSARELFDLDAVLDAFELAGKTGGQLGEIELFALANGRCVWEHLITVSQGAVGP